MANNDPTAAINIIFDTPNFKSKGNLGFQRNPEISNRTSSSEARPVSSLNSKENGGGGSKNCSLRSEGNGGDRPSKSGGDEPVEDVSRNESSVEEKWWLVGCGEVAGLSTCKGRRLKPGEEVVFTFPLKGFSSSPSPGKVFGRGRNAAAACSEIVRFSTRDSGEVFGRWELIVLLFWVYLNIILFLRKKVSGGARHVLSLFGIYWDHQEIERAKPILCMSVCRLT